MSNKPEREPGESLRAYKKRIGEAMRQSRPKPARSREARRQASLHKWARLNPEDCEIHACEEDATEFHLETLKG